MGLNKSSLNGNAEFEIVTDCKSERKKKAIGFGSKKNSTKLARSSVVELDFDTSTQSKSYTSNKPRSQYITEMSKMETESLKLAEESSLSTKRSKALILETHQIGNATANTLVEQTEQLEKVQDDLIYTGATLDKTDRLLHELHNPFVSKFTSHKRNSRENQLQSAKMKGKPGIVRDLDDGESGGKKSNEREELLEKSGKGEGKVERKNGMESTEERLRRLRVEQDEDLKEIGSTVGELKGLANRMNMELSHQNEMIDAIDHDTQVTQRRLKENTKRTKDLL